MVRLLVAETVNDDVYSIVAQLPDWISHFVVQLSRRIEHVLAKCRDGAASNDLVAIAKRVDELGCNIYFSQVVVNNCRVSYQ